MSSASKGSLSLIAEQRLRAALPAGTVMPSATLALRLQAGEGGITRQQAYNVMHAGKCSGLLLVAGRARTRTSYALNDSWQPPARRLRYIPPPRAVRVPVSAALHCTFTGMPAQRPGPLVPSLGTRCDPEVMPPEIGELIDNLHQQVYRHAAGVE